MGDDKRSKMDARARAQMGLVTRAQAMSAGFSSSAIDRRLRNGELERVAPLVYRLRAGPAASTEQRLLAACLSFGEGAMASHRSAALLWRLDGFKDNRTPEISVPRHRDVVIPGVTVHRRRSALDDGYCVRNGIPVTTLHRTLLDLEATLSPNALEIALDSAGRGHPDLFMEMSEFLSRHATRGRPNGGRLDALVDLRFGGEATGSIFETRLLQIIRGARLEDPTLQHPVFKEPDHPFVHIDFAWVKRKIALFADGMSFHVARRRAIKDAEQRLELLKLGWNVVVVFPKMLDDPKWISTFKTLFGRKP